MRRLSITAAAFAITTTVVVPVLWPSSTGSFPGTVTTSGVIVGNVARQIPGCGQCHLGLPGGMNIRMSLVPTQRSLDKSQAISVTSTVTGGQVQVLNAGGFINEATAGAFSAGATSQVDASGLFVTHVAATGHNRSWTYGYMAPSTAGLVELFGAANTVDLDGSPTGVPGDIWTFHGFDATAIQGTPVRLYVNETGVRNDGASCVGGFGNFPVLGSSSSPTAGNANFTMQVVGAAPSAPATLLVGLPQPPLPLSVIGVNGCFLYVNSLASLSAATSAGNAQRGEGVANFLLPIPPTVPRGLMLAAQAVIVDAASGRSIPVTLTNAIRITIQ
jgi:hypothetical protein